MQETGFGSILSARNRGILLDIVVFILNMLLMVVLSSRLDEFIRESRGNDSLLKIIMSFYCIGICFLLPVGALLKRRNAQRRHPEIGEDFGPFLKAMLIGQFLAQILFLLSLSSLLLDLTERATGVDYATSFFALLFFGIPLFAGINTALVYFYFVRVKHQAIFRFMDRERAEQVGDVLIFFNMILYQAFWGILTRDLIKDQSGIFDRIFTAIFSSVIIYLPPRIFYLAEDRNRRISWMTIVLANIPLLLRIFVL